MPYNLTTLHPRAPVSSSGGIPTRYAVVVDAGSSGSRIQVFSWKDPSALQQTMVASGPHSSNATLFNSVPEITQDAKFNKKITPGLSSFAGRTKDIWKSHLHELIKHAELGVPKEDRKSTPLFVLATAGMRLLPEFEQQEILSETCNLLRDKTSFYIPECESHVSIIDGETEALYGWLSLNYLLQTFNSYKHSLDSSSDQDTIEHDKLLSPVTPDAHHSYGFMDMGGASMQIAFAPNSTETEKHLNDLYTVRVRSLNGHNQEWRLFVSSWLGFGANEARRRYAQHLLEIEGYYNSPSSSEITPQDPCFPAGLTHDMKIDANTTLTYEGAGNFTTCLHSMQPLLRKDQPCNDDPCLFNGVHAPLIDFGTSRFVGVSEYWHTANDILKLGGRYDFEAFSERVAEYCAMPWSDLVKQTHKGGALEGISQDKLQTACFKATWVLNVLHSGFGLPIDESGRLLNIGQKPGELYHGTVGSHNSGNMLKTSFEVEPEKSIKKRDLDKYLSPFQSAEKIESTELTWMLGRALLYASSQVPPASPSTSDVGYLPADVTTKHYVLGGELDGSIAPGVSSSTIENDFPEVSRSHYGVSQFLGFFIIFVILGYAIMYAFNFYKYNRQMVWSSFKLRITSLSKSFYGVANSLRRIVFGDSHGGSKFSRHGWGSGGYQRVLEEGGFAGSTVSLSSIGNSHDLGGIVPEIPLGRASTPNALINGTASLNTSPLRGKNGKEGSKFMSASTTALNRMFGDKSTPPVTHNSASPLGPSFEEETAEQGGRESVYPNKFHIPTSTAAAVFGRSTSMIDLSAFQNPMSRPPSRPSSRMGLFSSTHGPGGPNPSTGHTIGSNYNHKNGSTPSGFGMTQTSPKQY